MRIVLAASLVITAAACGGDDAPPPVCNEDGGEACFQLPTAALAAYPTGGGPDDPVLGCGGYIPAPSTAAVTMSGAITKYGAGAVADATLEVFGDDAFNVPIATTTTDADGNYTVTIPQSTPDLLWGTITADGYLDAYLHNARPDLSADITDFNLVTLDAALLDTLTALVEDERDAATVAAAVVTQDCENSPLEHAAVTVSATAGERDFIPGVSVYYGVSGSTPLPATPEDQPDTADNGSVAILNIPAGEVVYVQAWGFPDGAAVEQGEAGLVLVAEYPVIEAPADSAQLILLFANQD